MTNFEKYEKEIKEILRNNPFNSLIAVTKYSKPVPCTGFGSCTECLLDDRRKYDGESRGCYSLFIQWLYEEYVEVPVLTPKEHHFIMSLPPCSRIKVRHGDCIEIDTGYTFDILRFSDVSFVPEFSNLENDLWYDTMEMREWEVDE